MIEIKLVKSTTICLVKRPHPQDVVVLLLDNAQVIQTA